MQQAVDCNPSVEEVPVHLTWGQENMFYVKALLEMKRKLHYNVTLTSREDTMMFAAMGGIASNDRALCLTFYMTIDNRF